MAETLRNGPRGLWESRNSQISVALFLAQQRLNVFLFSDAHLNNEGSSCLCLRPWADHRAPWMGYADHGVPLGCDFMASMPMGWLGPSYLARAIHWASWSLLWAVPVLKPSRSPPRPSVHKHRELKSNKNPCCTGICALCRSAIDILITKNGFAHPLSTRNGFPNVR